MAWYNSDWKHRKAITIDSAKVDGDLTDWPLLVHLDSDSDLAEKTQSDGDDILFTDGDGATKLSHEIESYDGSTGTLWAHVKVPSLSASSDTSVYLYYGNDSASNQESVSDVWSNGYEAVYHLDESAAGTGTADVYKDSTANNNHGDDLISASDQTGQIGRGENPDGSDDEILVPHDSTLNVTGNHAVSFWVKSDGRRRQFVSKRGDDGASYQFWDATNGFRYYNGNITDRIAGNYKTGWQHAMFSHTGSEITFYTNGDPVATASISDSNTTTSDLHLGQDGVGNFGSLPFDEVRIQSTTRSDAWVAATYANQDDPLSFYTVGDEEKTGVTVTMPVQTLSLSEYAPTTDAPTDVTTSVQSLSLDDPSPTIGASTVVDTTSETLSITQKEPEIIVGSFVTRRSSRVGGNSGQVVSDSTDAELKTYSQNAVEKQ